MKENKTIRKFPIIDLGRCTECCGCMEVAPDVFHYNHETGMMDIFELSTYPEDVVIEAIKNCPKDCITWEVVGTKPA